MAELSTSSEQSTWRFELKYRISYQDFLKIRNAVTPYMRRDSHTQRANDGRYLVQSLYFDTYGYKSYHEKMNGDHERLKFRIRTYSTQLTDSTFIRVEMKVRKGNAMEKHGVQVSAQDYLFFMKNRHWPQNTNLILQEFERYLHLWDLRPKVLIRYYREGYEDRERNGIRITFDHHVSGAHSDGLFPDSPVFFRSLQPNIVILEIKCRHKQPDWVRNLVRNYGLRWVANSKFTQGIQSARNELYHPNSIVIIR